MKQERQRSRPQPGLAVAWLTSGEKKKAWERQVEKEGGKVRTTQRKKEEKKRREKKEKEGERKKRKKKEGRRRRKEKGRRWPTIGIRQPSWQRLANDTLVAGALGPKRRGGVQV